MKDFKKQPNFNEKQSYAYAGAGFGRYWINALSGKYVKDMGEGLYRIEVPVAGGDHMIIDVTSREIFDSYAKRHYGINDGKLDIGFTAKMFPLSATSKNTGKVLKLEWQEIRKMFNQAAA